MKQKTFITILTFIAAVAVIILLIVFTSGKNKRLNNYENISGDDAHLEIRDAAVGDIDIRILESFPVQVHVTAYGDLPDGCTEVREVLRERNENVFNVMVRTERPRDAMCTLAVRQFEETFPLDVENLPAGTYTVNVNGVIKTFTLDVDNIIDFDAGKK